MSTEMKPILGTTKEPRHNGLILFGYCWTASVQSRLDDLNPFSRMNWRNFDIGLNIERNHSTGGSFEIALSLLFFAVFIEVYNIAGREAFAKPLNEIRDAIQRGEVETVTMDELKDRLEADDALRQSRGL